MNQGGSLGQSILGPIDPHLKEIPTIDMHLREVNLLHTELASLLVHLLVLAKNTPDFHHDGLWVWRLTLADEVCGLG